MIWKSKFVSRLRTIVQYIPVDLLFISQLVSRLLVRDMPGTCRIRTQYVDTVATCVPCGIRSDPQLAQAIKYAYRSRRYYERMEDDERRPDGSSQKSTESSIKKSSSFIYLYSTVWFCRTAPGIFYQRERLVTGSSFDD
jgi:hypothetical protein